MITENIHGLQPPSQPLRQPKCTGSPDCKGRKAFEIQQSTMKTTMMQLRKHVDSLQNPQLLLQRWYLRLYENGVWQHRRSEAVQPHSREPWVAPEEAAPATWR